MVRRSGIAAFLSAFALAVSAYGGIVVEQEVVGPVKTNGYLVYDTDSCEAALVDVPGPVDRLLAVVDQKGLRLEYVLITHGHPDHTVGAPAIRERFPDAKLCMSKEEHEDTALYRQWETKLDSKEAAAIKMNPAVVEVMNFDLASVWAPDIVIRDGQTLQLGKATIRAITAPGHSRGSICYLVGDHIFTGDVLFHRSVGRSDLAGAGGWDQLVASVRHLYTILPDATTVHSGHGPTTDIASERCENPRISEHSASRK